MIRVLLVDDQEMLRSALATIIESDPRISVVGQAADGALAYELAQQARPDVVVMDIRMPGMDGLQATRLICADAGLAETRVLVLTMFELEDYVYQALKAGASGFLLKDAPAEVLVDAIRRIHAGESLLAPSVMRQVIARYVADPVAPPAPVPDVTPREKQVWQLVAEGLSNAEIEDRLFISHATCKTHISALLRKTASRDRAQLVVRAYQSGLARRYC